MADFEHFLTLGKSMELTGDRFFEFAKENFQIYRTEQKEKEDMEREEHRLAREEKQRDFEENEKRRKYEEEMKRLEQEAVVQLKKMEVEEAERVRRHELKLKSVQHKLHNQDVQLAALRSQNSGSDSHTVTGQKSISRISKLPAFNSEVDDMDAYLQRFELYATAQGWNSVNWATNLSALLTGKGSVGRWRRVWLPRNFDRAI